MKRTKRPRPRPLGLSQIPIVQVGMDLFRLKVKSKRLLNWFQNLGDVTVTEDGRVLFPRWMLPAILSLYAKSPAPKLKPIQLRLWED